MWRNPKYPAPDAPPPADPPRESGRLLASLERRSPDGSTVDLRVTLDEYNGRPFVSIRQWARDRGSAECFPTKKGTSIRLSEVADIVAALQQAVELVGVEDRPRRREGPPDRAKEWGPKAEARPIGGQSSDASVAPPWGDRPEGPPRSGEEVDDY